MGSSSSGVQRTSNQKWCQLTHSVFMVDDFCKVSLLIRSRKTWSRIAICRLSYCKSREITGTNRLKISVLLNICAAFRFARVFWIWWAKLRMKHRPSRQNYIENHIISKINLYQKSNYIKTGVISKIMSYQKSIYIKNQIISKTKLYQ